MSANVRVGIDTVSNTGVGFSVGEQCCTSCYTESSFRESSSGAFQNTGSYACCSVSEAKVRHWAGINTLVGGSVCELTSRTDVFAFVVSSIGKVQIRTDQNTFVCCGIGKVWCACAGGFTLAWDRIGKLAADAARDALFLCSIAVSQWGQRAYTDPGLSVVISEKSGIWSVGDAVAVSINCVAIETWRTYFFTFGVMTPWTVWAFVFTVPCDVVGSSTCWAAIIQTVTCCVPVVSHRACFHAFLRCGITITTQSAWWLAFVDCWIGVTCCTCRLTFAVQQKSSSLTIWHTKVGLIRSSGRCCAGILTNSTLTPQTIITLGHTQGTLSKACNACWSAGCCAILPKCVWCTWCHTDSRCICIITVWTELNTCEVVHEQTFSLAWWYAYSFGRVSMVTVSTSALTKSAVGITIQVRVLRAYWHAKLTAVKLKLAWRTS